MIIHAKVFPKSKKERIAEEDGALKIYTKEPAEGGKANRAVVGILSKHFKVKKGNVKIVKGLKQKNKIVKIIK